MFFGRSSSKKKAKLQVSFYNVLKHFFAGEIFYDIFTHRYLGFIWNISNGKIPMFSWRKYSKQMREWWTMDYGLIIIYFGIGNRLVISHAK